MLLHNTQQKSLNHFLQFGKWLGDSLLTLFHDDYCRLIFYGSHNFNALCTTLKVISLVMVGGLADNDRCVALAAFGVAY